MAFCVDAGSRSLSDDGLVLNTDMTEVNATVTYNAMKKSSSCDLERLICKDDDHYNKSITNGLSFCEVLFDNKNK